MKGPLTCLLATFLGTAQLEAQTPQTQADPAPRVAQGEIITREIGLADLGLPDGLTFRQLSGTRTLYVPIPDGTPIRGGALRLNLRHGATVEVDRYLQVSVGGRAVATQALEGTSGEMTLRVPLRPQDVSAGFLTVELTYSGALSDKVCVDDRASGDFLQIAPTSAALLSFDASSIATAAAFAGVRPDNVRVTLSQEDTLAGLAAATRAAALFGAETGRLRFGETEGDTAGAWSEAAIALETTTFGAASEMTVEQTGAAPLLRVRGTDPQIGLWQLASAWSGLAAEGQAVTELAGAPGASRTQLPLGNLDADLNPRLLISTEDFVIPFQSSDLPAGTTATGVSLNVAAALDPEGRGATASVFVNDTLLGSSALSNGAPQRLAFAIPRGLTGRDNVLRVSLQRQVSGGECRYKPQGYPVQVLPGSAITLSEAEAGDSDFFALRRDFGDGVQVVLDPALGLSLEDALPWLSAVAGSMIPDRAPIVARGSVDALEGGMPFLVISADNPGDGAPLITFDQGRIELRDRQGQPIFAGDSLSRLGVAQIVSRGDFPGLWLRPGAGDAPSPTQERPFILDRGDLALIGAEGIVVATSTDQNPLVDVAYPDRTSIAQILAKYRLWIVGGAWLLLTLAVLIIFQRLYRRGRTSGDT